jgi:hypothetical protein
MTFLDSAKIKRAHLRAPKRGLEERLFYRRRALPRFYTAKTQRRHRPNPRAATLDVDPFRKLRRNWVNPLLFL